MRSGIEGLGEGAGLAGGGSWSGTVRSESREAKALGSREAACGGGGMGVGTPGPRRWGCPGRRGLGGGREQLGCLQVMLLSGEAGRGSKGGAGEVCHARWLPRPRPDTHMQPPLTPLCRAARCIAGGVPHRERPGPPHGGAVYGLRARHGGAAAGRRQPQPYGGGGGGVKGGGGAQLDTQCLEGAPVSWSRHTAVAGTD